MLPRPFYSMYSSEKITIKIEARSLCQIFDRDDKGEKMKDLHATFV
jgi:hypothetical protein